MFGTLFRPLARRGVRRAALVVAAIAVAGGVVWFCRGSFVHRATAQQAARTAPVPPVTATATASDYASRVVAYIHQNRPITRQELGEFLVARQGADKLPLLLNKRIVDVACQQYGISVTAAEVDAALGEELKDLAMDRKTFLKNVLARYKKNLYEFKEDVVRPRLQLTRLVQRALTVSEDDLRKAYDSVFGEKVECRIIIWPHSKEKDALEMYSKIAKDEAAFAQAAKNQDRSDLQATGGKINPISRYSMDPKIEEAVFKLRPGEVTELLKTPDGIVMLKCDRRLPADTSVNFAAVRDKLEKEIREKKLLVEMGKAFQGLRQQAAPEIFLKKIDRHVPGPMPSPGTVVATIHGKIPITREELGEFLIARFGGEKLEYLINRRILDLACQQKNIVITEQEVDQTLKADLAPLKLDLKAFEKEMLAKWGKSMYEWREDVIKTRLMLNRLCQGRVKWTKEDLDKCFKAYHGERLECRMILWPAGQERFAQMEYGRIRDSEVEFDRKARSQASPTLASKGGKLPVFGHCSLDNENLEREAFKLQPGEVSVVIETPQGAVVIKCDRRIPPDNIKLEQVRDELVGEIMRKKTDLEMQVVFKELKDRAAPKLLLKGTGQPEDLAAETQKLMSDLPPLVPQSGNRLR
jgi:parvulin-like peptidyl-prolyl isomerase